MASIFYRKKQVYIKRITSAYFLCLLSISVSSFAFADINQELLALVKQDQIERKNGEFTYYNDQKRIIRVKEIIASGSLKDPEDYFNAALIFQHGHSSDDYLKAFELSSKAAELGHHTAKWLSCAAEDRYLLSLNKPQIWGTQFNNISENGYKLSMMDETAKTDKERNAKCNMGSLEDIKKRIIKLNQKNDRLYKSIN